MNVLLINGSPNEKGCTYTALSYLSQVLEKRGIDSEILHIGKAPVGGCIACGKCDQLGKCVLEDSVNKALEKAEDCHGFVFGSPVYFASPNGSMIGFMDRLFHIGNFAHKPAAVVASARRGGCTATLDVLLKYPMYNQMPVVSADYWPIIHGNTPEEVLQDKEGLFTLDTLGRNMAWMLNCIEAGKANGVIAEEVEKDVWTNFVR